MKKRNFLALLGAVLIPAAFSTAAIAQTSTAQTPVAQTSGAQTSSADDDYLNTLYGFLKEQDEATYAMATSAMTPAESVWAAQMFCQTFSSGAAPSDVFAVYTSSAIQQAETHGIALTDEMAYSVGLYGGAVMNIGSAYYCPEYQPQVQQALQAL